MDDKERVYFDPETVALLREILDGAWAQSHDIRKTTLAEHILKSAAQGERDRGHLLDAALMEFTAERVRSTDDCSSNLPLAHHPLLSKARHRVVTAMPGHTPSPIMSSVAAASRNGPA